MTVGALTGWRVLELSDGAAAAFCAKILCDLGADVVLVEPPSGHRLRQSGPRRHDGLSGRFAYLSTGKASVVVDGDYDNRLRRLVADADVVVTDRLSDDLAALAEAQPGAVVASILPFGATGPYAGHAAHHLTIFHTAGEGSTLPSGQTFAMFPDRPPIQLGNEIAFHDAGWNAAVAILAACYDRLRSGRGRRIDVSVQESELTLNRTLLSRFNNDGIAVRRDGRARGLGGTLRCADGWVHLYSLRDLEWDRLLATEDGREFVDTGFTTAEARAADLPGLAKVLADWCLARSKHDVTRIMAPTGVAVGIHAIPEDMLASEQLAHRGFFHDVDDGQGGTLRLPGAPYRLSATPVVPGSAPALGSSQGFRSVGTGQPVGGDGGRFLEGVRVVDFTWAAAGPYATMLLAFFGAEVVKVESGTRPDAARRGFMADYGGVNRSPNFNEINLNKRSLRVDLSDPRGRDIVRRLIATADVVVDNFRPGVMERFGFGPAALHESRPGLIVASSSANGSTGPEAMTAGYARIFGATGGLSEQTGYPDGPPIDVGESTDYRSANALAVGILAALLYRARTGEGQRVDLASREVVIGAAPDALLAHVLGVPWESRLGNAHREMSPHGVYPCAGDDEWVAVAVGNETEWRGLCRALGRDDWVALYPSAAAGSGAATEFDEAIAAWTRQRSPEEASATLQAVGVAAARVMTNDVLASDPHLVARGFFVEVQHPEIGRQLVMRPPWIISGEGCGIGRHGPLLGQDNEYVLEDILGMAPTWRDELVEVLK